MSTHLLVLIHGMWGNPVHLSEMHRIITEKFPLDADSGSHLEVLVAQTNRDQSTYDGIDWGGERIAEEVSSHVPPRSRRFTGIPMPGVEEGGGCRARWNQESDPFLCRRVQSRWSPRSLCTRVSSAQDAIQGLLEYSYFFLEYF